MKEGMMIKQLYLLGGMCLTLSHATSMLDQDFDGVPDAIDQCQDTPFLNEVDATGCTTNILILPFETERESLIFSLGYGFSTNDDLKDRNVQYSGKVKLGYYLNSWGYTLQTGYYKDKGEDGSLDTIVRVQKRIKLHSQLTWSIGTGVRLPNYAFEGNEMDGLLYTSLHYYPTESLSFFTGYSYTYIGDDEAKERLSESVQSLGEDKDKEDNTEKELYEGLQNTHKFYLGAGYFFTESFYMNLTYSDESNKFISEHHMRAMSTSLYYKINKQWFTTLYYKREILDEDVHDTLLFSIGYHIW